MPNLAPLFKSLQLDLETLQAHEDLFIEAFTHRSSVKNDKQSNNERLEFLGDAVLELVTTEFLYENYNLPEGELTNYRSALVKRENLSKVATKLDLGHFLILSKGEERSGGRTKEYLLANVLEALIGALYLSYGMKPTAKFIAENILVELKEILADGSYIDAKTRLQEITQGAYGITPTYEVVFETGKDHEKNFEMAVKLGEVALGSGEGRSKKEAQIDAAQKALDHKSEWENDFPKK